jgi:hypothetical protein
MARRRMIDPNIWSSEDMSKLTLRQRLLVIGLFSNADDYGKGKAKATYVRSMVFPYDDITVREIEADLQTIHDIIAVQLYDIEGNSYYKFLNWEKWQTVQKPQSSMIPEPVENHSGMIPDPFSPKGKEEKGKEVGKEEKGKEMPALDSNPHKDHLLALINECEIQDYNLHHLDIVYSYIGVVDIEVIETAIKKSAKKSGGYLVNTINGMVTKDGITKASQLRQFQVLRGGSADAKHGTGHSGYTDEQLNSMSF